MNRAPPLLLVLLLLAPRFAWAELPGLQLYENGEYEAAARVFEQVLADPHQPREEQGLACVYLAASRYALGQVKEARKQLEVLAREYPEQRADPVLFIPELVALAEVIRQQVEAEREFAAREAELRRPVPAPPLYLRPETVGLFEAVAVRWALGAGVAVKRERLEGSVRVLLGSSPTFHLQGGVVLGDAARKPFLGVRTSLLPGLGGYGAGPVVGMRWALPAGFEALVEVGADYFFIGTDDYYRLALTGQAGLGFDVRLP